MQYLLAYQLNVLSITLYFDYWLFLIFALTDYFFDCVMFGCVNDGYNTKIVLSPVISYLILFYFVIMLVISIYTYYPVL
jgi:hypothetical protein